MLGEEFLDGVATVAGICEGAGGLGRGRAARSSAEKVLLQPTEDCVFTTLGINSHLFACTRDSYEALVRMTSQGFGWE